MSAFLERSSELFVGGFPASHDVPQPTIRAADWQCEAIKYCENSLEWVGLVLAGGFQRYVRTKVDKLHNVDLPP